MHGEEIIVTEGFHVVICNGHMFNRNLTTEEIRLLYEAGRDGEVPECLREFLIEPECPGGEGDA